MDHPQDCVPDSTRSFDHTDRNGRGMSIVVGLPCGSPSKTSHTTVESIGDMANRNGHQDGAPLCSQELRLRGNAYLSMGAWTVQGRW